MFNLRKSAAEAEERTDSTYSDNAVGASTCCEWFMRHKSANFSVDKYSTRRLEEVRTLICKLFWKMPQSTMKLAIKLVVIQLTIVRWQTCHRKRCKKMGIPSLVLVRSWTRASPLGRYHEMGFLWTVITSEKNGFTTPIQVCKRYWQISASQWHPHQIPTSRIRKFIYGGTSDRVSKAIVLAKRTFTILKIKILIIKNM